MLFVFFMEKLLFFARGKNIGFRDVSSTVSIYFLSQMIYCASHTLNYKKNFEEIYNKTKEMNDAINNINLQVKNRITTARQEINSIVLRDKVYYVPQPIIDAISEIIDLVMQAEKGTKEIAENVIKGIKNDFHYNKIENYLFYLVALTTQTLSEFLNEKQRNFFSTKNGLMKEAALQKISFFAHLIIKKITEIAFKTIETEANCEGREANIQTPVSRAAFNILNMIEYEVFEELKSLTCEIGQVFDTKTLAQITLTILKLKTKVMAETKRIEFSLIKQLEPQSIYKGLENVIKEIEEAIKDLTQNELISMAFKNPFGILRIIEYKTTVYVLKKIIFSLQITSLMINIITGVKIAEALQFYKFIQSWGTLKPLTITVSNQIQTLLKRVNVTMSKATAKLKDFESTYKTTFWRTSVFENIISIVIITKEDVDKLLDKIDYNSVEFQVKKLTIARFEKF